MNADALLQRIQETESRLQELQQLASMGLLAGLIAHEVNNLLTPALTYVQMASAHPTDAAIVRKALDRSASSMRAACSVSETVLALTKGSPTNPRQSAASPQSPAPNAPANEHGAPVATTLTDALALLGWDQMHTAPATVIQIPDDLQADISAVHLRHVFTNLLLNARSAITHDHPCITIRAEIRSNNTLTFGLAQRSTPMLTVHVADNGRGLGPDELTRLRASLENPEPLIPSSDVEGTNPRSINARAPRGLGLSLCNQLIRNVGGTLTIDSQPGAGATVTLSLPAVAPASQRKLSA